MYKLEYLPVARKDMLEIVRYISRELQNPDAADRLAGELVNAAEGVLLFPYWVDEEKKLVTVARVVYAKRDYGRLLE